MVVRARVLGVATGRRGRTAGHDETRTADQLDGISHIAAAAAPHRPRTGRQVRSRARIRDGGGTAPGPDSGPADGR